MTNDLLLKQIGNLLDTALKPIKKQLVIIENKLSSHDAKFDLIENKLSSHDAKFDLIENKLSSHDAKFDLIENKLSSHDAKFEALEKKISSLDTKVSSHDKKFESLEKLIKQSQEETIETLSELIYTGYNMHEKRIRNIEKHLHLPYPQE